jgi:uncharacterized coiled-coil DUF342 family protein
MDRYYIYTNDDARIKEEIDKDGDWVKYEDAAARIRELEAEISERRLDYTEDCKRLDAAINDFEHQLAAAQERNVALQSEHLNHVNALHEQLTAMTVERDSESRRAKHYSDKVTELEQQLAAMQRIIDSYRRII